MLIKTNALPVTTKPHHHRACMLMQKGALLAEKCCGLEDSDCQFSSDQSFIVITVTKTRLAHTGMGLVICSADVSAVEWRGECRLRLISWSPITGEQLDIRSPGDGHFSTLYGDSYRKLTAFYFQY